MVVIGTRPEAIKMFSVVRAMEARSAEIEPIVLLTGQHEELVDDALTELGLRPDIDLGIMTPGQSLADVGVGCLRGLAEPLHSVEPDVILVQGDTATVFFGALAAFFQGPGRVRVGHVEAGLRTDDRWAPYPEEMLRRLTTQLTDFHFAPTSKAFHRLEQELAVLWPGDGPEVRRNRGSVHRTGNTVVDTVRMVSRSNSRPRDPVLAKVLDSEARTILLTMHRRESFGEPMERTFRAIREVVESIPDLAVVYPVHPNPQVQDAARRLLGSADRIHLCDPFSYRDLVLAMERATVVLTDSGGIQEEAPSFDTPVLVLRDRSERPEGIEAGVATLVGTDPGLLRGALMEILEGDRSPAVEARDLYGDGRAGERIADILISTLTGTERITEDWSGT